MNCQELIGEKDIKYLCGGEVVKKGHIDNAGLGTGEQTIYQCEKCKNITII